MSLLKRIGEIPGPTAQTAATPTSRPESAMSGRITPASLNSAAVTRTAAGETPRAAGGVATRPEDHPRAAEIRKKVQERLVETLDPRSETQNIQLVRRQIEEILASVLDGESIIISRNERMRLLDVILHDIIGLGPLEDLLAEPDISEILVNGPKQIYVERKGRLETGSNRVH